METCWEMVSYMTGMLNIGIAGYIFYCLIRPFLQKNKYAGCVGVSYSVILIILYCIPYPFANFFPYIVSTITAFFVMYFTDPGKIEQKIFLTVTFYLVDWIAGGIALVPRSALFELFILTPEMTARPILQFYIYVMVELLYMILQILIRILFVRLIHRTYVCKNENLTGKELILLLSPSLSILTGYWLCTFFVNAYEYDYGIYIWNVHPEYEWLKVLYQAVSFLAMLTVIVIFQSIKKNQRKEKEDAILSGQMEEMQRHINEVEKLYRDMRSLKHDMGNHVMTLENLYRRNLYEDAKQYARQLKGQLETSAFEIKTGNPVTDVILTEKQKEAKEKGIDFVCEFHYPEGTKINAFDISIILYNAVGNAIENAAECEKPYIRISSCRKKNAYLIEVKNSFTGERTIDEESGLPETTKRDRQGHGYGLANIRKVAQKYFGDIEIEQDGWDFILSILLMAE